MAKSDQKKTQGKLSSELNIILSAPDKKIKMSGFAVALPAGDGVREIRGLHTPCLGTVDQGEMKYYKDEDTKNPEVYAVHNGFFKVLNDTLVILVHATEKVEDINVERARQAKKRAAERLDRKKEEEGELDIVRAQMALRRALTRINLWEQHQNS